MVSVKFESTEPGDSLIMIYSTDSDYGKLVEYLTERSKKGVRGFKVKSFMIEWRRDRSDDESDSRLLEEFLDSL